MRCPSCQHLDDRVIDSRLVRAGGAVRRRRECVACGHRFTTYERAEEEPLTVRKRSGVVEPFQRSKLKRSIQVACAKRPVADSIDEVVDEIEEALARANGREVTAARIGELVMERLSALDQVAYVRFASVYRNFQETTEFEQEVRELKRRQRYEVPGQEDLFADPSQPPNRLGGEEP
ncbi:MAG: transcriptional repressor NrdR [Gemmatimonadota bacterium]|nr:MAG: transcriptional repressor NrdR [Gemmatimonadota bacterium]